MKSLQRFRLFFFASYLLLSIPLIQIPALGQSSASTIESLWATSPVSIKAFDRQNRAWITGKTLRVGYLGQDSSEYINFEDGNVTFEPTGRKPFTEADLPSKDGTPREPMNTFPKLLGSPITITFGPSGFPWVTFKSKMVARFNGSSWVPVSAKADRVYFGGDGSFWATLGPANNKNNQYPSTISKWENGSWKDMGKKAIRFAVDGDGNAWALTRLPDRKVVLETYESGAWQSFPLPQPGSPKDLLTIDPSGKLCIHARVNPYGTNTVGVYGVFRLEDRKWSLIAKNTEKVTGTVDYNEFFVMENDALYLGSYYKPDNAVRAIEGGSQFANFGFHFFDIGLDGTLWAAKTSVGGRGLPKAYKWLGGNQWEVFLLEDRVLDLDVDRDGSALISGFFSIYRLNNGKIEKATGMNGAGHQLAVGANGDLIGMQTKNGKLLVAKRDGQQLHTVSKEPLLLIQDKMPGIAIDGDDTIWSIQPAKNPVDPRNHYEPVKLVDGRWETVPPPEGKFASLQPGVPISGKDGNVYYGLGNQTFGIPASMYKRDGSQWVEDRDFPTAGMRAIDKDGYHWYGPAKITTNREDLNGWTIATPEKTTRKSVERSKEPATSSGSTQDPPNPLPTDSVEKASPQESNNATSQSAPKSIVGCWYWSNGSYVTITDDGKAKIGDIVGLWEKNGHSENAFTIRWPGIIDTVSINRENTEFQGKGLFNTPVSAIRIGPAGNELAGTWRRIDGATLEISEDHKVTNGDFHANWEKTGDRSYKITWPLDDQVTLSQDGTSLAIQNQFATISANRDPTCGQ